VFKRFGSPACTASPYNQGTPVFFRQNLLEILGTLVKTSLKGMGTCVEVG